MYHQSKKICPVCGKIFLTSYPMIKYCSEICRQQNKQAKIHTPRFKIQRALQNRFRHELERLHIKVISSARQLLGCSLEEFIVKIESQFKPEMSWKNYGKWHLDHIRPIATFDLSDFEQQRQCFHHSNFQPLWAEENLRKRNKYLI